MYLHSFGNFQCRFLCLPKLPSTSVKCSQSSFNICGYNFQYHLYGVMRHKRFLKENHRVLYANLMTSGKLAAYLDEVEQQTTAAPDIKEFNRTT